MNVETRPLPKRLNGLAQVAAATPSVRYLRIALKVPNGRAALLAVLSRELQHAVEVAGMPEVRDGASLAAAYTSIGTPMARGGYFETDAALETGRLVAREIAEARQPVALVAAAR